MKGQFLFSLCVIGALIAFPSCKKGKDKKFNPKDRTTVNMNAEEKAAAVERLKESMSIDIDSMLYSNGIKMSVLPPSSESLTQQQKEYMGAKMLQMLAQNGVGGVNNVPGFALTARIVHTESNSTGTVPQKFLTEIEIDYSVINTASGDTYAVASQKLQGVGSSQEQSVDNALKQMNSNKDVALMLHEASGKIVRWFEENLSDFKSQLSRAEANNDYALALALIQSVPNQAKAAFAYAESRRADIENKFKLQIANSELIALKQSIMDSGNDPSAEVYAHYQMIPPSSPYYSEAKAIFNKYEKDVEAKRVSDASERRATLEAERQNQLELAKMETTRILAKYEAQASEQAIRLHLSQNSAGRGFWSNLGARIIGAIDGTNWQYRVKDKPYTED